MNVRALTYLFLFLPSMLWAQGFAGLGTEADGFAIPRPGKEFSFPQDHGAHPQYRIEWWYLTANLKGADGRDYGLQWTLFRSALRPETADGWASPQLWMGHAAVTTPDRHFVTERLARGGIGQAGVSVEPFEAWIDDWVMAGSSDLTALTLRASGFDFSYDMTLKAEGPLVFHGQDGFSVKSEEGQASYYYSQPFFAIEGTLDLPGGEIPVTGHAWLDREWSSQPLSETQKGWDWFSLVFDNGDRMMAFQLRQTDGTVFSAASWITPDGDLTPLPNGALTAEPLEHAQVAQRDIPVVWRVRLPEKEVDVTVRALNPQSWMRTSVAYWEGPVLVDGSHSGQGYLEMTGYEAVSE
ncbi:lipocalin-like domain-containing protein [Thalassococcus sp. S3]|uniref:lipocalin-like domain-containing protein n=1 Tax=Thalassococcus sp. S3 TaxID=2017482 RepID=UPI0010243860|nr:lipocalin-like domain-containing protein [Thalassococcus sp. S3]QBF31176.1 iron ABC transporter permease [Thalassococcus sp. S3]